MRRTTFLFPCNRAMDAPTAHKARAALAFHPSRPHHQSIGCCRHQGGSAHGRAVLRDITGARLGPAQTPQTTPFTLRIFGKSAAACCSCPTWTSSARGCWALMRSGSGPCATLRTRHQRRGRVRTVDAHYCGFGHRSGPQCVRQPGPQGCWRLVVRPVPGMAPAVQVFAINPSAAFRKALRMCCGRRRPLPPGLRGQPSYDRFGRTSPSSSRAAAAGPSTRPGSACSCCAATTSAAGPPSGLTQSSCGRPDWHSPGRLER